MLLSSGGLLVVGLVLLLGAYGWACYKLGQAKERQRSSEMVNEMAAKQLDEAAQPAHSRTDLLDRLRRSGGL